MSLPLDISAERCYISAIIPHQVEDEAKHYTSALHHPLPLSPVQRLAARRLGAGESVRDVAEAMKIGPNTIDKWKELPEFVSATDLACQEHERIVSAMLHDAEVLASQTMVQALESTNGDGSPNWRIRLSAAISLLDRAGQRGAPVARQEISAQVNSHVKVQQSFTTALRDPTVRAYLLNEPSMAGLLKAAAEDAEVIEVNPPEVANGLSS